MEDMKFKPCPFCGITPSATKHFKHPMWRMIHRCAVIGPICIEWMDSTDDLAKIWNVRHEGDSLGLGQKD